MNPFPHLNLKAKPYNLFGLLGFLAGVISFLPLKGEAVDINLHDTYWVIDNRAFCALFAITLLFLWAIYIAARNVLLSKKLSWLHVATTLLPIVILMLFLTYNRYLPQPPRQYYAFSDFGKEKPYLTVIITFFALITTFVIGQILFLVNVVGGLIKQITK